MSAPIHGFDLLSVLTPLSTRQGLQIFEKSYSSS